MSGPEPILKDLGIELASTVDPSNQAVLEPEFRILVNDHFFWTAGAESRAAFLEDPHLFTGPVQDPVSGEWFSPTGESPRMESDGRTLLFETRENMLAFQ